MFTSVIQDCFVLKHYLANGGKYSLAHNYFNLLQKKSNHLASFMCSFLALVIGVSGHQSLAYRDKHQTIEFPYII